jgi:AraC family transcriptional regulator
MGPRPAATTAGQSKIANTQARGKSMGSSILKGMDQPRLLNGPTLLIAGTREHYTLGTIGDIPAQWKRFAPYIGNIPGQTGHTTFGVCCDFDGNGGFDYICGVEVSGFSELSQHELPQQWDRLRILEQKYAVFTHSDHLSTLKKTYDAIYRDWLPQSGKTPTSGPTFERYDENFNPATGMGGLEIWIPIY